MYSITYGVKGSVDQGDQDRSFVEIDNKSPLSSVVIACPTPNSTVTTASNSSLSDQLVQFLFAGYGYTGDPKTISEFCEGSFLQEYAISCVYNFTEDFLSIMKEHKIKFISRVDSILIDLQVRVDFSCVLKESKDNITKIIDLMNRACSSFSKKVYDLRAECIRVLQYDIIPITIQSIFDSSIVDGGYERKMTYSEMEQLFLHFITNLEKLVMVRVMKSWRDFCNSKKSVLSLITDIDYRDPFICAHRFDQTSIPNITCPAAFTNKIGKCVSFMAIAKIDEMMSDFIVKCNCEFKEVVNSRCSFIFNCSNRPLYDLKALNYRFLFLIKGEFYKKIIKEGIDRRLINFLNNPIVIWKEHGHIEINGPSLFDNIIEYVRNFLLNTVTSNSYSIIKDFQRRLLLPKQYSSVNGENLNFIENSLGLKFHPEDSCKILSVRRKFVAKHRKVIKDKFFTMLEEGYRFLDGTVISAVDWDDISINLFPIAQVTVRNFVDLEDAELSKFLHSARIIEDIEVSGSSSRTRKITSEEIEKFLKFFSNHIINNEDFFASVWKDLIKSLKINKLKEMGHSSKFVIPKKDIVFDESCALVTTVASDSLTAVSSQIELPVVASMTSELLSKRDEIINMWGLNIHPDDNEIILFIRKEFSVCIKDHLIEFFSDVFKNRKPLPSGRVPSDYSWFIISNELSKVATESSKSIIENQCSKLCESLFKSRVVDICENDSASCIVRKITDGEKNDIMIRDRKCIDDILTSSIRLSWFHVVNENATDITGYGYREKHKYKSIVEGKWGVKLRYTDNTDILNVRRRFSSRIKKVVHAKFSGILKYKYKFYGSSFTSSLSWSNIYRELIPIAKDEIKYILEEEKEEIKQVISKARVVINQEIDREIEEREVSIVLKNIMSLVGNALRDLFRRIWDDVISCSELNSSHVRDNVPTASVSSNIDSAHVGDSVAATGVSSNFSDVDGFSLLSVNVADTIDVGVVDKHDSLVVKFCSEDDDAILNIKKFFSSEIYTLVNNKCVEILKEGYIFEDGTTLVVSPWKNISKKLIPILNKEINPIIENERAEIRKILLKLRAFVLSPESRSATVMMRELTLKEVSSVLDAIMKSVCNAVLSSLGRIWNRNIKLPLVDLAKLSEESRLELDDIRFEFIGSLGAIVNEVIGLLSSSVYTSLHSLDDVRSSVFKAVSERSNRLFKEGGFLSRVELLLSNVKAPYLHGDDRFLNDEEKKYILEEFIAMINFDRDCLIKKRTIGLKNIFLPMGVD
ncbi:hypothetical protein [Candidatus Ichthyocystis hellenicum]|uniref:hypothetical protein n=1 Tax=Candidatus Ichthyocystis hellenicum TaxID=1561003 RepID=UPI000B8463EB|nr:hypothetical protein [Candidatus Ichthyocystis hellenicum]